MPTTNFTADYVIGSNEMNLMYEELARARMREAEEHAIVSRRLARVRAARRWERKAREAAHRANLARALV
ncbi:MAG: hypothetical protein ACR2F6_05665 [Mycobacteriales bacterium]